MQSKHEIDKVDIVGGIIIVDTFDYKWLPPELTRFEEFLDRYSCAVLWVTRIFSAAYVLVMHLFLFLWVVINIMWLSR